MSTLELFRKQARRRRKTPTLFQGVDLEQEAWRYCQAIGYVRNVELHVKHSTVPGVCGHQWLMVTTMTIGYDATVADVLQVLLHEVSHIEYMDHSEAFIEHMITLGSKVWNLDLSDCQNVPRGSFPTRAYAVDQAIRRRLLPHLSAGGYQPAQGI